MGTVFGCLTGVITLLFGFFVWLFKRMVTSLELLHAKTLPTLSIGIQAELRKQTASLDRIEKQSQNVCRHPPIEPAKA
jgi:hypothetical protein